MSGTRSLKTMQDMMQVYMSSILLTLYKCNYPVPHPIWQLHIKKMMR